MHDLRIPLFTLLFNSFVSRFASYSLRGFIFLLDDHLGLIVFDFLDWVFFFLALRDLYREEVFLDTILIAWNQRLRLVVTDFGVVGGDGVSHWNENRLGYGFVEVFQTLNRLDVRVITAATHATTILQSL